MNSINPNPNIIISIFTILIKFIFECDNEEKQFKITNKIIRYFHDLDQQGKNAFEIISFILASIENEKNSMMKTFVSCFSSFMKALILMICKNPSLFNDWYQDVEKSGIFQAMRLLTDKNPEFTQILEFTDRIKNMQTNGVNVVNDSTINTSQNGRGQIEEIIDQLKTDKILTIKDPFFDLGNLKKEKKIGSGTYGVVFLAESKEKLSKYAVKTSKYQLMEEDKYSAINLSIFREINLMSSFDFPTVLKSIGYSPTNFEGKFSPTIIMEFCSNNSLFDMNQLEYKGQAPKEWNDTKKLMNAYGIAAGMKYLHQHGILHRDLKTGNILLDELLCPKICDFGFAKVTNEMEKKSMNVHSFSERKGTGWYLAPEIWSDVIYSNKSDVYAFAYILYEMLVGENPFLSIKLEHLVIEVLINGNRPQFHENVPEHIKDLIERCWAKDPNDRPSFDDIVNELKNDPLGKPSKPGEIKGFFARIIFCAFYSTRNCSNSLLLWYS